MEKLNNVFMDYRETVRWAGVGVIKSVQKIKSWLKSDKVTVILHKGLCTFITTLLSTITMIAFVTKITNIYMDPMVTLVP